ncbi:unnamed protein product, partial [Ectocarpus sp. 12 AP-2014]
SPRLHFCTPRPALEQGANVCVPLTAEAIVDLCPLATNKLRWTSSKLLCCPRIMGEVITQSCSRGLRAQNSGSSLCQRAPGVIATG